MSAAAAAPMRVYAAYCCGQVGLWILRAIVLYDAFDAQDPRGLALVVFALFVPIVVGSQVLAPRFARLPHRGVMAGVEILRVVLIALLAAAGPAQRDLLAPLVVLVLGLAQPVFVAAQVAYLRAVTDDARLVHALGAIANIERATNIVGLVVGALILASLSVAEALVLSMAFVGASAAVIVLLLATPDRRASAARVAGATAAQARFLFAAVFLLNAGAGVINLFQPIASLAFYDAGPQGLALMFLVVGVLGLAGALVAGPTVARLGALPAGVLAAGAIAACLCAMALPLGLVWSAAFGGLMLGFGQIFAVSTHATIVMLYPAEESARGSGRFQALTFGGIAANALGYAALAPLVAFEAYVLACAFSAALAAAALLRHRARLHAAEPLHAPTV